MKKIELSTTPTTSTESAATNTSDAATNISADDHVVDVKDSNKEKNENKTDDENDDFFPPYVSNLQRLRRKVSVTNTFVRNAVNSLASYCYNTINFSQAASQKVGSERSFESTFDKFLERRTKEKEALYFRVSLIGIVTLVIGTAINTISVAYPEHTWMFAVESICGAFIRVVGFCIMSIVPTNELDFMKQLCTNYYFRLLSVFLLIVFIILWAKSNSEYMKNEFYFKFLLFIQVLLLITCFSWLKKVLSYQYLVFSLHCCLVIAWLGNGILELDTFYQFKYIDAALAAGVFFLISFLALLQLLVYRSKFDLKISLCIFPESDDLIIRDKDKDGWGSSIIFMDAYISFFFLMVGMMIRAVGYLSDDKHTIALYWFLAGAVDILPMIPIALFGEKKCFGLLARYYEYNIETLQKDGECLSRLVSNSITDIISKSQTTSDYNRVWILRENKISKYRQLRNKDFIKGTLLSPDEKIEDIKGENADQSDEKRQDIRGSSEYIKIIYVDDIGCYYYFEGEELKEGKDAARIVENNNKTAFEEWKRSNFKDIFKFNFEAINSDEIFGSNLEEKAKSSYVIIRREKKANTTSSEDKEEDLITWANKNMRMLDWGKHSIRLLKSLLKESPRFIGSEFKCLMCNEKCLNCTEKEKERLFNLATQVPPIKWEDNKIDYFVSHSWDDDPEQKWEALKKFCSDFFKKNKRYPTLWLDKVCIDQRNSAKALEVLPINIASSKKMLVIMSSTYLSRLWCIWELFTLFSFCSKELAIERLEIIYLEPKSSGDEQMDEEKMIAKINELAEDPIESSHCFGPDEEYKLRKIMYKIGLTRLKEAFEQIGKALKDKMKPSLYDDVMSIMSSITGRLSRRN